MSFSGQPSWWQALRKTGLAVGAGGLIATAALFTAALAPTPAQAKDAVTGRIYFEELPREARKTYELIHDGGPFPYAKDGTVFQNRERQLPTEPRGYYREYTVKTPGSSDRGARRIVCGGTPPTAPKACWYTADHYASFRRIMKPN